jgi:hypothetical protein
MKSIVRTGLISRPPEVMAAWGVDVGGGEDGLRFLSSKLLPKLV